MSVSLIASLSICASASVFLIVFVCLSVRQPQSFCLRDFSVCLSVCRAVCLSLRPSIRLSIRLPLRLFVSPTVDLSLHYPQDEFIRPNDPFNPLG
jgi:hypothetical protein